MALNREPAIIIGGLAGLITQVLPLLVILDVVNLSPEKLAALISVIGLLLTFIATTLLRSQVVPTEKSDALALKALAMPAVKPTQANLKTLIEEEKKEYDKQND